MNHIFRIVFDRQRGIWKVASEHARGHSKATGRIARKTSVTLAGALAFAMAGTGHAQPTYPVQTCTDNQVVDANALNFINTNWWFRANSILNASAANAISGGKQTFLGSSILNASAANAISGGKQFFYHNSNLNASVANAINGGQQVFFTNSILNASATNALNSAQLHFYYNSTLNASATNALNDVRVYLSGNGFLQIQAANALTTGTSLEFSTVSDYKDAASSLVLNGHSTAVGRIRYKMGDNHSIVNNGATDATLTVDGSVIKDIQNSSFFSGTIADGNGVGRLALVHAGISKLVLSGNNTYTGGTTISNGTLELGNGGDTGSIIGDVANDGTLVFNRSDIASFDGLIQGTGAVRKIGPGTTILTADNTYTGETRVTGGTLLVTGSIADSAMIRVNVNATLGGTGTVGNTAIASGGILAHGGVGNILTIDGDLSLAPGAIYQVYADPSIARSTLVHVTGIAMLNGASIMHLGLDGKYQPGTRYTILSADQAIQGKFAALQSNYTYLTPSLAYSPNAVTMELIRWDAITNLSIGRPLDPPGSRPMRFSDAANTDNQRATADALERLGAGNDLYRRIETLPAGAPPAAFDNLSGELHATTNTALQNAAAGTRALTFRQLRNNLSAGARPGALTAQAGISDAPTLASSLPQNAALPAWAEIVGNWQTLDGNGNAARATQRTGSLFIGADHAIGNGWRAGGALGYTESTLRVNDRNANSQLSSYSALLYGGKAFETGPGKLNLLIGAGYTWHNIGSQRSIHAAGLNQSLKADYRASTSQLFTELGYVMPLSDRTSVEPFADVVWSGSRTRGFSESGGSAALSGRSSSDKQTSTTLGVRGQTDFTLGGTDARLIATLGWRHAFREMSPQKTMAFNRGQTFTVAGTPIARNAALAELGAEVAVSRSTTLALNYNGQYSKGSRENAGSLRVRWVF